MRISRIRLSWKLSPRGTREVLPLRLLASLCRGRETFSGSRVFPSCRFLRSVDIVQAEFPLMTVDSVSNQAPSLHGRYPLPRYYEPVRLPNVAARAVIDSRPALVTPFTGDENSISPPRHWVSQVPRLIFARALSPLTPEGSLSALAHCFLNDSRLRHLRKIGRLHWCHEAGTSSLALRLARSPCEAPHPALLLRTLARLPVKRATTGLGHFTQPERAFS